MRYAQHGQLKEVLNKQPLLTRGTYAHPKDVRSKKTLTWFNGVRWFIKPITLYIVMPLRLRHASVNNLKSLTVSLEPHQKPLRSAKVVDWVVRSKWDECDYRTIKSHNHLFCMYERKIQIPSGKKLVFRETYYPFILWLETTTSYMNTLESLLFRLDVHNLCHALKNANCKIFIWKII